MSDLNPTHIQRGWDGDRPDMQDGEWYILEDQNTTPTTYYVRHAGPGGMVDKTVFELNDLIAARNAVREYNALFRRHDYLTAAVNQRLTEIQVLKDDLLLARRDLEKVVSQEHEVAERRRQVARQSVEIDALRAKIEKLQVAAGKADVWREKYSALDEKRKELQDKLNAEKEENERLRQAAAQYRALVNRMDEELKIHGEYSPLPGS